ncbi:hypothetical protein KCP78_03020 [Salmonella enterica subsp. enterica]|nr:hypothetical protein KCP78_03020 [Salmonella enterica subsp. enterica]
MYREKANYGWPRWPTWGVSYSGHRVPEAKVKLSRERAAGLLLEGFSGDQRWDGFYASDVLRRGNWKLFIGALKDKGSL